MRKHLKKLTFVLLAIVLCPLSTLAQNGTYETIRDLESWTSAKLKYKHSKKLDFSLEQQLRLKDDASTVDQYFTEFTVGYDILKPLNLTLGARYAKENDNVGKIQGYETHFRWNTDLTYKHSIERFDVKYRLRYQNKDELNVTELEGDTATQTARLKIGMDYNIRDWKFDPNLSAEIFNRLSNSEGFNRIRLTLGTSYAFKKAGELGAFYRYEKQLKAENPKTTNIIGIKYQYTLKRNT